MHECNYEQTNYIDGVSKYYCTGCNKGFFMRRNKHNQTV